jgi:hypothetical protein
MSLVRPIAGSAPVRTRSGDTRPSGHTSRLPAKAASSDVPGGGPGQQEFLPYDRDIRRRLDRQPDLPAVVSNRGRPKNGIPVKVVMSASQKMRDWHREDSEPVLVSFCEDL